MNKNTFSRNLTSAWRPSLFLGVLAGLASAQVAAPAALPVPALSSPEDPRSASSCALVPGPQGAIATHHTQGWSAEFDSAAVRLSAHSGAWNWGLGLVAYGWGGALNGVTCPRSMDADGALLNRTWDEVLGEWYVHSERGLEHGYTLRNRPESAAGLLELQLEVLGGLQPRLGEDGRSVSFMNAQGAAQLHYGGLRVFDQTGRDLIAWFLADGTRLRIIVDDSGAAYPLLIDPLVQTAYFKASNPDVMDQFGGAVAVDGRTVAIGTRYEDSAAKGVNGNQADNSAVNSGAVYVFVEDNGVWTQEAYLKASNTAQVDNFGLAVALSGETLVVGAPGEDSSANTVNGNQNNNSFAGSGAAYVFRRTGSNWAQEAYLKASNCGPQDSFGEAVAISGNTIVVGAPQEGSSAVGVNGNEIDNGATASGAAYVFVRTGTTWVQEAYLKASNTGVEDRFGSAVTVSGDWIAVGAPAERSAATGINGNQLDNSSVEAGAVYLFRRTGSAWAQQAYVKASNTDAQDAFGAAVALSGNTLVVGAAGEQSQATGVNGDQLNNGAKQAGAAYVFEFDGSGWFQQAYLKALNAEATDQFGDSVAVLGNWILIGAPGEASKSVGINGNSADNNGLNAGAAYLFYREGPSWKQEAYVKASNSYPSDRFGTAVALGDDLLVLTAAGEDSAASGVNGNDQDNSLSAAGAAWAYRLDTWRTFLGCTPQIAQLVEPPGAPNLNSTTALKLVGNTITNGFAATLWGVLAVNSQGCGLPFSATEELLLATAPVPQLLGITTLLAGQATQNLSVPNDSNLIGIKIALQSLLVDPSNWASESSNALVFEIVP
jgi:hypothetical protein